jgi:hypothetical protein
MSAPELVYTFQLTRRFKARAVLAGYREACAEERIRWYDPRALWFLARALWCIL